MTKRFYWLKLKEDFFDDDTISFIEEQPNGVYYVNFYLKLCLKSLKAEGKLIRLVGDTFIPYDAAGLAKLTNTPIDTVKAAMSLFQSIGLVKVLNTGELYLAQLDELIGSETDKAAMMRRKRAEEKVLGTIETPGVLESGNNVTEMLPHIEIEKEIEIEQEQEIQGKAKKTKAPDLADVRAYVYEKGYSMSPEEFYDYYESVGWRVGRTDKKMQNWKAAVNNWERRDKEYEKQRQERKTRGKTDHEKPKPRADEYMLECFDEFGL